MNSVASQIAPSKKIFKLPKSHLLKGIKESSSSPEINLCDDRMKESDNVHLTKQWGTRGEV